jgi:hypothetical protein
MIKKSSLLLLLVVVMGSCDDWGEYEYYVENGLKSETITVKTHITGYRFPTEILDSVFVLLPKERKLIRNCPGSNLGPGRHPSDHLDPYQDLGIIEIFVNDVKLQKTIWEREYWKYSETKRNGMYTLVINEQIINED